MDAGLVVQYVDVVRLMNPHNEVFAGVATYCMYRQPENY